MSYYWLVFPGAEITAAAAIRLRRQHAPQHLGIIHHPASVQTIPSARQRIRLSSQKSGASSAARLPLNAA